MTDEIISIQITYFRGRMNVARCECGWFYGSADDREVEDEALKHYPKVHASGFDEAEANL